MDDELVDVVAADLKEYLTAKATELDAPVYAIAIFLGWGYLGVALGTETDFYRYTHVPAYEAVPAWQLSAPAGVRYGTGNWAICCDDFLSPATEAQLEPWLSTLNGDDHGDDLDEQVQHMRRAGEHLALTCMYALTRTLPEAALNTTPDVVAFLDLPDTTRAEAAWSMLATVPVARFRRLFPHWERLAPLARAALRDPQRMAELRELTRAAADRTLAFPTATDPGPARDDLTAALRDCGLHWADMVEHTDRLDDALDLADYLGAGRPRSLDPVDRHAAKRALRNL